MSSTQKNPGKRETVLRCDCDCYEHDNRFCPEPPGDSYFSGSECNVILEPPPQPPEPPVDFFPELPDDGFLPEPDACSKKTREKFVTGASEENRCGTTDKPNSTNDAYIQS